MKKEEILKKLKDLPLNKQDFVVTSHASLVVQDILDETENIDISYINDNFNYDENQIIKIKGYQFLNLESCFKEMKKQNLKKDKKIIKKLDLILGEKDNYRYERELNKDGITLIAGVDEVGRGPLVGNVVAAAVILPVNYHLDGLTDSKKLSEKKREEFYDIILKDAISVGIGEVSPKIIDEINIYEASKLAMKKAIDNLSVQPEYILIDALELNINISQKGIVKGDIISQSIAAASIIAKVTRDREMLELDKLYPEYGFKDHKGYPTKKHLENLKKFGVLENYRFTYGPIRDLIYKDEQRSIDKNEVIN